MSHGNSFTLDSTKSLHKLEKSLKNSRIIFISGEDCSDGFYIAPTKVAEIIEDACGGTHYPTSGWYLLLHCGDDEIAVIDNRNKQTKNKKEIQELKKVCSLGIEKLVRDDIQLEKLEKLLDDINAKYLYDYLHQDDEDYVDEDDIVPLDTIHPIVDSLTNDEPYLTNEQITKIVLDHFAETNGKIKLAEKNDNYSTSYRFASKSPKEDRELAKNWLQEKGIENTVECYDGKTYIIISIRPNQDVVLKQFEYNGYIITPKHITKPPYACAESKLQIQCKNGLLVIPLNKERIYSNNTDRIITWQLPETLSHRVSQAKEWIDSGFKSEKWMCGVLFAPSYKIADLWLEAKEFQEKLAKQNCTIYSAIDSLENNITLF